MNKNSTNNRKSPKVVSKYFTSSPVMDESLSEFKEKKTCYTGPKNSQPVVSKSRVKRAPKRIKGQKDIRTAINSKKNELLAYTKEFNEVCRKSGIDVDSEQLQLAIALSKSVQSGDEYNSQETKILSSKERTGRIRTTLQEYGFTVPQVNIKSNKRQKKKITKNYKLLLATEAERLQIIGDKYSQVLFENVCNSKLDNEGDLPKSNFYCMSTSISYNEMRNNDLLYVENLLERSYSNGRLLRDWAEIPGRPQSPRTCDPLNMNFSEIECSQEELDIVLSGTLKSAKSIVQSKVKTATDNNAPILVIDDCVTNDTETQTIHKTNAFLNKPSDVIEENIVTNTLVEKEKESECILDTITDKLIDATSDPNNSVTLVRVRSYSPDIFDDEASAVWDNSKLSTENCEQSLTTINKCDVMDLTQDNYDGNSVNVHRSKYSEGEENNDDVIMDLTGTCDAGKDSTEKNNCKEQEAQNTSVLDLTEVDNETRPNEEGLKLGSQLTHLSNLTRRKSNDLMEITECVAVATDENSSKKYSQFKNITRRDSNDLMEITECVGMQCNSKKIDKIDLTQNVEEPDHVILVDAIVNQVVDKVVDLSQSSHSDDELPLVQISGSKNQSLDDTILLNIDEIQSHRKSCNSSKAASQSFYDDFEYDHSNERSKETSDVSSHNNSNSQINNDCDEIDLTQSNFRTSICCEQGKVDLTQSSNSSEGSLKETPNKLLIKSPVFTNLGKKDEVSIDYDDLFDDIAQSNTNSKTDISSRQSSNHDLYDNDNENVSETCSQNSQAFNISDKELEYSINKSRSDFAWDVNFGGISVMDNLSGVENRETNCNKSHDAHNSMNKSMSDSYLPMVMVKKINIESNENKFDESDKSKAKHLAKENDSTPCKAFARNNALMGVNTPKSNEFIIKTDHVTPMQDYASMSTPERNMELDKYGLKPFKRKRAIQLLTHLYNQTHPVVESCQVDDLSSPSKKRKHSTQLSPINPLKTTDNLLTSTYKMMKSPNKGRKSKKYFPPNEMNLQTSGEIDVYEVTNELPDIKDVKCSEEDWVFQKREKAKVHSCRVPLHIALHNYVSCRRGLREAILKYEPVNIDIIHKELVASGFRYDPKDLLKYLDKKCITVKTADNNARNNRR